MSKLGWFSSALLSTAMVFGACASGMQNVHLVASPAIPAAEGFVHAIHTTNNNTSVEVDVQHLAAPGRVTPGATTYVVWARGYGAETSQNLGALQVDKNLRGTLKTVTPLRTFDVFITAEPSSTPSEPSTDHLMTARVNSQAS